MELFEDHLHDEPEEPEARRPPRWVVMLVVAFAAVMGLSWFGPHETSPQLPQASSAGQGQQAGSQQLPEVAAMPAIKPVDDVPQIAKRDAPEPPVTTRNITYVTRDGVDVTFDLHRPGGNDRRPVVLLLHGGGWWSGAKEDMSDEAPIASVLVEAGYVVLNASYRLTCSGPGQEPRTSFGYSYEVDSPLCGVRMPDQVDDLHALIRYVHKHAGELRADSTRIGILGASAGGNLGLLAAMRTPEELDVQAVVNWSGPPRVRYIQSQEPRPTTRKAYTIRASFTNAIGCDLTKCPDKWDDADSSKQLERRGKRAPFGVLSIGGERETQVPFSEYELFHQQLTRLGWTNLLVPGTGVCHGTMCGRLTLAGREHDGMLVSVKFLDYMLQPKSAQR